MNYVDLFERTKKDNEEFIKSRLEKLKKMREQRNKVPMCAHPAPEGEECIGEDGICLDPTARCDVRVWEDKK